MKIELGAFREAGKCLSIPVKEPIYNLKATKSILPFFHFKDFPKVLQTGDFFYFFHGP